MRIARSFYSSPLKPALPLGPPDHKHRKAGSGYVQPWDATGADAELDENCALKVVSASERVPWRFCG